MTYNTLEKFKKIVEDDTVFVLRAAIAPLFMTVPWKTGKDPVHCFSMVRGRDAYFCLNENRYFALATDAFHRYYKGEVTISELEEEYRIYERGAQQMYDEVTSKDLLSLSDTELQNLTLRIKNLYIELLKTIYIETIDYDKTLSIIGTDRKAWLDTIWEKATESTFVSFEGRYLRNMINLVVSGKTDVVRKAKYMFTDYFWAKSDDEISATLDDIRGNLSEKKYEADRIYAEAQTKKERLMTWAATLDSDAKRVVDYMHLMMYMRDIRKDPIAQMLAMLVEITPIMLERAGIDAKHAPYVLLEEYTKGVEHLRNLKADVETRSSGCMYLANPDFSYEIEHCDLETAVVDLSEWTKHHVHDSVELKGQIACRGCVRGVARVVSDPHDDRDFQDGDILVTSMTRPEFVPIMKKAGAVVTNEGGITCHAAIVSRELKIPCIIGTKIATQVLKDGDLVEVDAERGIVTILKSNKTKQKRNG